MWQNKPKTIVQTLSYSTSRRNCNSTVEKGTIGQTHTAFRCAYEGKQPARDGIPRSLRDIDSISRSSTARASRKLQGEEEISSRLFSGALISGFDVDYGLELSRTFRARHKEKRPRTHGENVHGSAREWREKEGGREEKSGPRMGNADAR